PAHPPIGRWRPVSRVPLAWPRFKYRNGRWRKETGHGSQGAGSSSSRARPGEGCDRRLYGFFSVPTGFLSLVVTVVVWSWLRSTSVFMPPMLIVIFPSSFNLVSDFSSRCFSLSNRMVPVAPLVSILALLIWNGSAPPALGPGGPYTSVVSTLILSSLPSLPS